MCARKRKPKTRRTKEPKGSLITIFLVFVVISILAAAIAYFFYDVGKPNKTPAKVSTSITKTVAGSQNTRTKSVLDGTWVSTTDGRMLEIHGTSFSMELPSVSEHKITRGKIHIHGGVATIIYSGTKDKCAKNPGTYSFVISKGSIHFTVKHDNCPGRKQVFSTTWNKF